MKTAGKLSKVIDVDSASEEKIKPKMKTKNADFIDDELIFINCLRIIILQM
jgi:hypothetical protein